MLRFGQNPWGRLHWLLPRLDVEAWSLVGCISTEERGLAVRDYLRREALLESDNFLQVLAPGSHPKLTEFEASQDRQLSRFVAGQGDPSSVQTLGLLTRHSDIAAFATSIVREREELSVILDITAMPKRFFFPLVKFLTSDRRIHNLVVTYAFPEGYSSNPLYEDIEAPSYIPAFMPSVAGLEEDDASLLVVAVGFESPGLAPVVDEEHRSGVQYLFPYPSSPPLSRGTWDFLRDGLRLTGEAHTEVFPVSARDPSATYERLRVLGDGGARSIVLAPYGPKPVSLGMCLYSLGIGAGSSTVRYAQPKHYSPHYSHGTATDRSGEVGFAYAIRLSGVDCYH